MTRFRTALAVLAVVSGAACSPSFEWREFVPEGSGVSVTFPCRPDRHARAVVVAGANVRMEMLVCTAAAATYAVSFFDVDEPARISTALSDLQARSLANVQGREPQWAALQIKGMTANPNALRLAVPGRLPDGSSVQEHAAFFTRGLRVYQATVMGASPPLQAVETFFGGLKFPG